MTGPIIPAELWPEDAHLHTWDSNGLGNWLRPSYGAWHLWATDIPLPPGHDWRVPVMRPTVEESSAVVPAIDLEHLRKSVADAMNFIAHFSWAWNGTGQHPNTIHTELQSLLALIDGQSLQASPVAQRKLRELQAEGFIVNGVAIFNPTTGRRGLVDYLGYVGWQTSEQPTKGEGVADG